MFASQMFRAFFSSRASGDRTVNVFLDQNIYAVYAVTISRHQRGCLGKPVRREIKRENMAGRFLPSGDLPQPSKGVPKVAIVNN